MSNYEDKANAVSAFIKTLSEKNPGVTRGFMAMHKVTSEPGALDTKQKELIALGIAITIRCEGCIACHVQDVLKAGATQEEIIETIGVAILMGGGPSIVYGQIAYNAMKEMT